MLGLVKPNFATRTEVNPTFEILTLTLIVIFLRRNTISGHRSVSLVFELSGFSGNSLIVFTSTTSVSEVLSFFFDAIISKKLWEWFLGASGPHLRTTYLLRMFWLWVLLETKSCLIDLSRRKSTREPSTEAGKSASSSPGCSVTIDFQFEVSFHYSVISVLDYFCFSMGAIVG